MILNSSLSDPTRLTTLRRVLFTETRKRMRSLLQSVTRYIEQQLNWHHSEESFIEELSRFIDIECRSCLTYTKWYDRYVIEAYRKGAERAFKDVGVKDYKKRNVNAPKWFVERLMSRNRGQVLNAKFSSTQFNITDKYVLASIRVIQDKIDPNDLLELDTKPHITVRYGLHTQDAERVNEIVSHTGQILTRIKRLSLFHLNHEEDGQEVLKFEIDSPGLHRLHWTLGVLPNTQTHNDYQPHLTVAYLKKGAGQKYLNLGNELFNYEQRFNEITFSDINRDQTEILLNVSPRSLSSRVGQEFKGLSDYTSNRILRKITDGVSAGTSKTKLVEEITGIVKSVTRSRARAIVETELTRIHAEAYLDTLEELGIQRVGVAVEWDTRNDGKVCSLCRKLDGLVLTVKEARGLLPRHVNCRCSFAAIKVGRYTKGQIRSQTQIKRAIDSSITEEKPGVSLRQAKKQSTWQGKNTRISKNRPKDTLKTAREKSKAKAVTKSRLKAKAKLKKSRQVKSNPRKQAKIKARTK